MAQTVRSTTVSGLAALALALALVLGAAAPSQAQPVGQEGLVNVNIGDVTVQLPIAIAANLCGIAVNVLAQQTRAGDVECDAEADAVATAPRNRQGGPVSQEGLVNVNAGDITVQAPIGIAANICDVAVNVLAEQVRAGDANCDAVATPVAEA